MTNSISWRFRRFVFSIRIGMRFDRMRDWYRCKWINYCKIKHKLNYLKFSNLSSCSLGRRKILFIITCMIWTMNNVLAWSTRPRSTVESKCSMVTGACGTAGTSVTFYTFRVTVIGNSSAWSSGGRVSRARPRRGQWKAL